MEDCDVLMQTSLHDLFNKLITLPHESIPAAALIHATERLIDIIFQNENISDEDRDRAKKVLSTVIGATEKAFENNP